MNVKQNVCCFSVRFELLSVQVQSYVKKVNDLLVRFNSDFKVILETITDLLLIFCVSFGVCVVAASPSSL